MEIPEKLFNIDIKTVEIGVSDIQLFSKEEIEEGQSGFRYNGLTNEPIKEWIGEEYIVIGIDSCCGDPIIVKTDDVDLPVYSMFHDDWSSLNKISDNFEQYITILKLIDNTDLEDKEEIDGLLEEIKKLVPDYFEYWNDLITLAYEFYTEE